MERVQLSKKMIVIVVIVLAFSIFLGGVLYYMQFNIRFENLDTVKEPEGFTEKIDAVWFTLRDENYKGFFPNDTLSDYGIEVDMDFQRYTYVITCGHEMVKLEKSYSKMKNRKFGFLPKQFIGQITLKEADDHMVHIYRIPRMDIDCNYHQRDQFVQWVPES